MRLKTARNLNPKADFDPLVYYVGRVERTMDPNAKPVSVDLSKYIDHRKKNIVSMTGEVELDYGNGVLKVNTPRSQAGAGFLSKAGPMQFGSLTLTCSNQYATIHVISLDGLPLSTSKKMLVQAFTEEKFSGADWSNGKITAMGHRPLMIRDIDATVTFRDPVKSVTVLDEQGYEKAPGDIQSGTRFVLPRNALYSIVTR